MKLLKDSMFLTKPQWRKLFLATTIMVVALYIVAMIFSLCGNNTSFYAELAKSFLMDKDAPEGKALKYYLAMK